MKKLIILDRDGVINHDSEHFIKSPEEWIPIPGSLEAITKLNKAGWLVAVATNQSGVGRGLFNETTLQEIHKKMQTALKKLGGHIDAIFYCPHTPDDHCKCRKPLPGLFYQIAEHFNCSLKDIPAIGDSLRDIEAAAAADCQPILVASGKKIPAHMQQLENVPIFEDLKSAVEKLLNNY